MKPEPLKDKVQKFHPAKTEINVTEGFSKQNILSAVEWLKEEVDINMPWLKDDEKAIIKGTTDKAFQDVIKK